MSLVLTVAPDFLDLLEDHRGTHRRISVELPPENRSKQCFFFVFNNRARLFVCVLKVAVRVNEYVLCEYTCSYVY